MLWAGTGRSGPRTRREIAAAYSILSEDTIAVRGELGRAKLDTVRLGATVDALIAETGRLRVELGAVRAEAAALRQQAAGYTEVVGIFASQSAEMRAQLVESQHTITELTERLTDLLEAHLEAANRRAASASEPTPMRPGRRHASGDGATGAATPPVTDLRAPEAAAAGDRLRLIRRALDV
jgi:chromosome segregation ATPase